jgi:hypothetical protein
MMVNVHLNWLVSLFLEVEMNPIYGPYRQILIKLQARKNHNLVPDYIRA